ncbi:MAG: RluA family pseudouridine synthase [Lachnospiraceae bacterium]|nr:RluA family pseudouridine synthase [Lachnospiraceae bacterium]
MQYDSFELPLEKEPERIDKLLAELYPDKSRSFFQKCIKNGDVYAERQPVTKAGYMAKGGDLLEIRFPEPIETKILPENIPLDILYEDDDLLIVNKPKGMVVHPAPGHYSGTLVNAILYHCKEDLSGINGEIRPGIVHRIDKDTTGSLVICKNDFSHDAVSKQLRDHSIKRIYRGIVCGILKEDAGTIDAPIGRSKKDRKKMAVLTKAEMLQGAGGREAVTHYRVLQRFSGATYCEFQLETGRTHQIRVHMASIGHPLYGDTVYGGEKNAHGLQGQTLHAMTIGLIHPRTGEMLEAEAPLPAYFEDLLHMFCE